MRYKNISERWGWDVEVDIAGYEQTAKDNGWEHGEFTQDENGIYEDGERIAEAINQSNIGGAL